jgi:hypothetical protein
MDPCRGAPFVAVTSVLVPLSRLAGFFLRHRQERIRRM